MYVLPDSHAEVCRDSNRGGVKKFVMTIEGPDAKIGNSQASIWTQHCQALTDELQPSLTVKFRSTKQSGSF
jgi:hypothetical protein